MYSNKKEIRKLMKWLYFPLHQQVKPSNPHEEQEILDGIEKVYYNTEGIDTSHYELRVTQFTDKLIRKWYSHFTSKHFFLNCFIHPISSATFQKLPEVLDLGDIDLDRKRLRKQLQVVIKDYMNEICVTNIPTKRTFDSMYALIFNHTGT